MQQAQQTSKIFGIGHSKTGTRSLTVALKMHGYSAVRSPTNLRQIERNDAATDPPKMFVEDQKQTFQWLC